MIKLEKDLYEPVKRLFEDEGYTVKGEVDGCDIIAVKDSRMIVCELKLKFNLKLVYQLLDRKSISKEVYAAVTTPKKDTYDIIRLAEAIDCGLIFVSETTGAAQAVRRPKATGVRKSRKAGSVKAEFDGRSFENVGGVNKTKLMTAYREQSIKLMCVLEAVGEASPKELKKMGFENNVGAMLYNNFYGWFSHIRKGVYGLSELGKKTLNSGEYDAQTAYFRREIKNTEGNNVQTIKK